MADIAELGFAIDSSPAAAAADNLDKMSASSTRAQTATERMQAQVDRTTASVREYMAFAREIQQYLQSEARDLEDVADRRYGYNEALKAGILNQKEYADALKALGKQEAALGGAANSAAGAVNKATSSFALSGGAARELGVMVGEVARGNFTRLEGSVITLTNRLNLMPAIFSPIGIAIGVIGAAIGGLIYYFSEIQTQLSTFNKALNSNQDASALTAADLVKLADSMRAMGASGKDADAAIVSLTNNGKFFADTLQQAAIGAAAFAEVTGASLKDATRQFEDLAKDPAKAVEAITARLNELDPAIVSVVAQLQAQGNQFGALTVATKAASDAALEAASKNQELADQRAELDRMTMAGIGSETAFVTSVHSEADAAYKAAAANRELAAAKAIVQTVGNNVVAGDAIKNAQEIESLEKLVATYGKGKIALVEYETEQQKAILVSNTLAAVNTEIGALMAKGVDAFEATARANADANIAIANGIERIDSQRAKLPELAKQYDALVLANKRTASSIDSTRIEAEKFLDSLDELSDSKYDKALSQYNKSLSQADAIFLRLVKSGATAGEVIDFISDATGKSKKRFDETVDSIRSYNDATRIISNLVASTNQDYERQNELLGMDATRRAISIEEKRIDADVTKALKEVMGPLTDAQQREIDNLKASAAAHVLYREEVQKSQEAARDWAMIWTSAGDSLSRTLSNVLVNGKSLFGGLVDLAKQTVSAIIEYFAKLAVINPILNSIFGGSIVAGGGSLLPTLANAAVGSATNSAVGSAANFASTASGGTQFSIMQPSSWIAAGKSLWTGFTSSSAAPGSSMFGTWSGNGAQFGAGVDPYYTGGGTYTSSALGTGLAAAGGVYAGYNRWQGSNKDFGGALGGVAYGVGTYSAAIGAGAAMSGGLAAGMAAIPVVGWIALAAMAVDMLSGGKLFGTGKKLVGGGSNLAIGENGADLTQWYTTKNQAAFFGGASWVEHGMDPGQQAIDAANAFFNAIKKGTDSFAAEFKLATSKVVDGAFRVDYDKSGKQTGTTTTINGLTYKGETQEQFAERITAESGIQTLKQLGLDVTKYTNQFIGDADNYAQVVQDVGNAMATAYQDITRNKLDISGGQGLQGAYDLTMQYQNGSDSISDTYGRLAQEAADIRDGIKLLTGQDTIASIEAFLRETSYVGESLTQTYQRIQQASQQYNALIAQFAPATYVDDFEASISNLRKSEQDAIAQANALAKAAGLEGAKTEDLVKIHESAAKQFAALVDQLQTSAQSLAFNLGLSNTGTLDQINAEIERLQGLAGSASSSVGGFGDAMQSASQKATDAINLLLGNLSPLNDQEKLQKALQAQMQGLVAPDAVLDIGRRLYASSSAYTALFNQVMQIGDRTNHGAGSSYSGGASFTASDQARLNDLLAQRDQLQKVAQLQQYQTLAQQIAEIASAKGEDYMQVISDMGISLKDFEKGLGVANDDALKTYIENIQAQKDSEGQNTASIVDAINHVADLLQRVLDSPKSPVGGPGSGGVVTVGDDGNASNGGGRSFTDGDADAFARAAAFAIAEALSRPSGDARRGRPT